MDKVIENESAKIEMAAYFIREYTQKISDMDHRINILESKNCHISDLENRIDKMENQVNLLNEKITNLDTSLNEFKINFTKLNENIQKFTDDIFVKFYSHKTWILTLLVTIIFSMIGMFFYSNYDVNKNINEIRILLISHEMETKK